MLSYSYFYKKIDYFVFFLQLIFFWESRIFSLILFWTKILSGRRSEKNENEKKKKISFSFFCERWSEKNDPTENFAVPDIFSPWAMG